MHYKEKALGFISKYGRYDYIRYTFCSLLYNALFFAFFIKTLYKYISNKYEFSKEYLLELHHYID